MAGFYEHDNEEIHKNWKFLDRLSIDKTVETNMQLVKSAIGTNRLALHPNEKHRIILRKVN